MQKPYVIECWLRHPNSILDGTDEKSTCLRQSKKTQSSTTMGWNAMQISEDNEDLVVEDTEESPEDEALPALKYEIFSYPSDLTLKGYLEQWGNDQLFIPEFQRQYVWDQTRASKLIESFLLGLPVPPVFLYKPAATKSFWVIDGHQRIRTIVDFQKGFFGEARFRLKSIDGRWAGKSFEELSEEDRFTLETTVLRAIVIQQTHPADHSSIYQIFERLNTGGIRLNPMEVRQCVYGSDFLKALAEMNADKNWRRILGSSKEDKRLKDRELTLRVVALFKAWERYEKPMKGFLNECASDFKVRLSGNRDVVAEIGEIKERFLYVSEEIIRSVGDKPFHLKGRLNFSALDAVMATLMKNGFPEDFGNKFKALTNDAQFSNSVSFSTSDESVLKKRFELAVSYLA